MLARHIAKSSSPENFGGCGSLRGSSERATCLDAFVTSPPGLPHRTGQCHITGPTRSVPGSLTRKRLPPRDTSPPTAGWCFHSVSPQRGLDRPLNLVCSPQSHLPHPVWQDLLISPSTERKRVPPASRGHQPDRHLLGVLAPNTSWGGNTSWQKLTAFTK